MADQQRTNNEEVYNELSGYLSDALQALDKLLEGKETPETVEELKYIAYSSLLTVSDDVKDMLKALKKKYKLNDKEIRERMEKEDAEPDPNNPQ